MAVWQYNISATTDKKKKKEMIQFQMNYHHDAQCNVRGGLK